MYEREKEKAALHVKVDAAKGHNILLKSSGWSYISIIKEWLSQLNHLYVKGFNKINM